MQKFEHGDKIRHIEDGSAGTIIEASSNECVVQWEPGIHHDVITQNELRDNYAVTEKGPEVRGVKRRFFDY
jgi:hypothetical protein